MNPLESTITAIHDDIYASIWMELKIEVIKKNDIKHKCRFHQVIIQMYI